MIARFLAAYVLGRQPWWGALTRREALALAWEEAWKS